MLAFCLCVSNFIFPTVIYKDMMLSSCLYTSQGKFFCSNRRQISTSETFFNDDTDASGTASKCNAFDSSCAHGKDSCTKLRTQRKSCIVFTKECAKYIPLNVNEKQTAIKISLRKGSPIEIDARGLTQASTTRTRCKMTMNIGNSQQRASDEYNSEFGVLLYARNLPKELDYPNKIEMLVEASSSSGSVPFSDGDTMTYVFKGGRELKETISYNGTAWSKNSVIIDIPKNERTYNRFELYYKTNR